MPDLIALRLHPLKPIDGVKFEADYLQGLTIQAYDLSYAHPTMSEDDLTSGNLIGEAKYLPNDGVTRSKREDYTLRGSEGKPDLARGTFHGHLCPVTLSCSQNKPDSL